MMRCSLTVPSAPLVISVRNCGPPPGPKGITKRPPDGGKGLDGVVELAADAYNPALELLSGRVGSGSEMEVSRA